MGIHEKDEAPESMEIEENTAEKRGRRKQNAGILHAITPMPIKKERQVKQEKDSSESEEEEAEKSSELNFQKVAVNEEWEKSMQKEIDEAIASNEKPPQMDTRFIRKRPEEEQQSGQSATVMLMMMTIQWKKQMMKKKTIRKKSAVI